MSEYGVTLFGFRRKPLETIQKEIEDKARKLFGEDADLSVHSPIGLFSKMLSWQTNLIWQDLENTYENCWLDTATGTSLEKLAAWGGLSRKGPQSAIIQEQLFNGVPGSIIPKGILVETPGGIQFQTIEAQTIDASGKGTVSCVAVVPGPEGTVPVNSVTVIASSSYYNLDNLTGTTNITGSIGGRPVETDEELRARFYSEGVESAGSSPDAIRRALLAVPGVQNALVYENTEIFAVDGRPPKSIECIVLGGENEAVATAIFNAKAAGIETYGTDVSHNIAFEGGSQNIKFSRLNSKYVRVVFEIDATAEWTSEYEEDIIRNTIEHIGGIYTHTVDGEPTSTNYPGEITTGIIYPWKIAAANKDIPGIENIQVQIIFEDDLHGHQAVSVTSNTFPNNPGDSAVLPGDGNGIMYDLQVTIDGTLRDVSCTVDSSNNTSWHNIIASLDSSLASFGANAKIEASNIVISSQTEVTIAPSTIQIADGANNGLLAAIIAADGSCMIQDAVEGKLPGNNKLTVDFQDIARCENGNIIITVNQP